MATATPMADVEMQSFTARNNTFHQPHQLRKRRASSTSTTSKSKKKDADNTLEWPHESPKSDDLARAGFFYRPGTESPDNVQCFFCSVKLDGWEPTDDPLTEHLSHSPTCQFALALHAGILAQKAQDAQSEQEMQNLQNPMDESLVAARKATFTAGAVWPHENKRGWKCKVNKMVEAGWCFDPAPTAAGMLESDDEQEGDAVSCFYCSLALDGWEPKDDPWEEHRSRRPECAFFELVERFSRVDDDTAGTKGKGAKTKGAKSAAAKGGRKNGRSSVMSKTSRTSEQTTLIADEELQSVPDAEHVEAIDAGGGLDDSIMSTASQVTATGTTKGKKKGGRPKAAAKGAAKGKKKATATSNIEDEVEAEPLPVEESKEDQLFDYADLANEEPAQPQETTQQDKKGRKPRQSKQPKQQKQQAAPDSSLIEISSIDATTSTIGTGTTAAKAAKKPTTRGRKPKAAKAAPEPEPEPEPEVDADEEADASEVSAQLQEELERSMDWDVQAAIADVDAEEPMEVEDEPTPQHATRDTRAKGPKRGVKRTSDGVRKNQQTKVDEEEDVTAVLNEAAAQPASQTSTTETNGKAKGKKKGGKGKNATSSSVGDGSQDAVAAGLVSESEVEIESQSVVESKAGTQAKKSGAVRNGKGRGRSTSKSRAGGRKASSSTAPRPRGRPSKNSLASESAVEPDGEDAAEVRRGTDKDEEEDLDRDEREIEAELERIALEERALQAEAEEYAKAEAEAKQQAEAEDDAIQIEQDKSSEFEPSPPMSQRKQQQQRQSHNTGVLDMDEDLPALQPSVQGSPISSRGEVDTDKENLSSEPEAEAEAEASSWIQTSITPAIKSPSKSRSSAKSVAATAAAAVSRFLFSNSPKKEAAATSKVEVGKGEVSPLRYSLLKAAKNDGDAGMGAEVARRGAPGEYPSSPSNASDQENTQPASPSTTQAEVLTKHKAPIPAASPTKTTRIPLANTPSNARTRTSPTKTQPKTFSHLTSTNPWIPIDIDGLLQFHQFDSLDAETVREAEGGMGGVLTEEEKGMTVQEWISHRARLREEDLRRQCEGMVTAYEREGLRALESLGGIVVG